MAMPKSTPRRPGNPGQNRDSRDGVFGPPESQFGPLPRVGLYARVSTPHQHTIRMQLRQLREFLERRRWQEVLVVEEVVSGSRRRPERDRLLDAAERFAPGGRGPPSRIGGTEQVRDRAATLHRPHVRPSDPARRVMSPLFPGDPSDEELARDWTLSPDDLDEIQPAGRKE